MKQSQKSSEGRVNMTHDGQVRERRVSNIPETNGTAPIAHRFLMCLLVPFLLLTLYLLDGDITACKADDTTSSRLKVALLNWNKPFELLDALQGMCYDIALVTTVPGDDVARHARWADEVGRRGLEYLPLLWWTPPDATRFTSRRFIDRSGRKLQAPCPLDERYWRRQVCARFARISQLRTRGFRIYGLGLDIENYWPNAANVSYPSRCYCDHCVNRFCMEQGLQQTPPQADKRHSWLTERELLQEFEEFQSAVVRALRLWSEGGADGERRLPQMV